MFCEVVFPGELGDVGTRVNSLVGSEFVNFFGRHCHIRPVDIPISILVRVASHVHSPGYFLNDIVATISGAEDQLLLAASFSFLAFCVFSA